MKWIKIYDPHFTGLEILRHIILSKTTQLLSGGNGQSKVFSLTQAALSRAVSCSSGSVDTRRTCVLGCSSCCAGDHYSQK